MSNEDDKNDDNDKNDSQNQDYEVGYKKPPAGGQFKPGQSGNPRGRPRKSKLEETEKPESAASMKMIHEEEMNELLSVRSGGKQTRMSARRLMYKTLKQQALQEGNLPAMRELLKLEQKYGIAKPSESDFDPDAPRGGVLLIPKFINPDGTPMTAAQWEVYFGKMPLGGYPDEYDKEFARRRQAEEEAEQQKEQEQKAKVEDD